MTQENFHALLLESENEQWIYLQVTEILNLGHQKKEVPSVQMRRFNIEQLIKGWDIDTASSYLVVDQGPFKKLRYKTTSTIAEIDAAASESFSISVS
jgi:hypothetical protein